MQALLQVGCYLSECASYFVRLEGVAFPVSSISPRGTPGMLYRCVTESVLADRRLHLILMHWLRMLLWLFCCCVLMRCCGLGEGVAFRVSIISPVQQKVSWLTGACIEWGEILTLMTGCAAPVAVLLLCAQAMSWIGGAKQKAPVCMSVLLSRAVSQQVAGIYRSQ